MAFTHAQRLERWLGPDKVETLVAAMQDWYGPPIALAGVPGNVWAMKGGEFGGIIKAGQFGSALDFGVDRAKQMLKTMARRSLSTASMAGFTSLSDLIAEATAGKRYEMTMSKTGVTKVAGGSLSMWGLAGAPAAGANGSALPGGRACDNTTTGAMNAGMPNVSTDTRHIVSAWSTINNATGGCMLLYDRLFDCAPNFNSNTAQSITGVPTRYQSSTATAADYAGGNFAFVEIGTVLASGAHNYTVCRYRNQAGTDAQSFPSMTGNSACITRRLDHPLMQWFMPLAAGDSGVMDLDQFQLSAAITTGDGSFVIGHPLAYVPITLAYVFCQLDGINTAFNLVRIFDGACINALDINAASTTASNYAGGLTAIHG